MFRSNRKVPTSIILDEAIQRSVLSQLKSDSTKILATKANIQLNTVMLIYPPGPKYIKEDRCQAPLKGMVSASLRPPIDLASIANSLSSQFQCLIRDYPAEGKNNVHFIRDLFYFKPRYLIVQFTYPTFHYDIKACELAKVVISNIEIIGKGPCFLWQADRILKESPCLDIAVVGEAEETIQEIILGKPRCEIEGIVFRQNGEILVNKKREFIKNLDIIAFPDRSLIKNELYRRPDTGKPQTVIHVQRGCPYQCTFCLAGLVSGHTVRYRSVYNTIEEIEECLYKYKINNFFLKADSFTINKSWVYNFCQEINKRNLKIDWFSNSRVDDLDKEIIIAMKKAGCCGLALGIESGSQATLDRINKKISKEDIKKAVALCKEYDLQVLLMFIIGWPWDNKQSIDEMVQFAKELNGTLTEFNFFAPFPGTPLFEKCHSGGLINEGDIYNHDYSAKRIRTVCLNHKQLVWFRRKAYLAYYLRPRYFKENILPNAQSFKDYLRFFKYGIQKLYSIF